MVLAGFWAVPGGVVREREEEGGAWKARALPTLVTVLEGAKLGLATWRLRGEQLADRPEEALRSEEEEEVALRSEEEEEGALESFLSGASRSFNSSSEPSEIGRASCRGRV